MMYTTQNIGRKSNKNVTRISHPQRFFSISSIAPPALPFFFLPLDYLFSTWCKIFPNIRNIIRLWIRLKREISTELKILFIFWKLSKIVRAWIDINFELNNFAIIWQAWKGRERKRVNKFIFGGRERGVQKRSFKCISRIIN